MSIIKAINEAVNESLNEQNILVNIVAENCKILQENRLLLCESAEGFLGVLLAKLDAGHDLDIRHNDVRNMFGILTALDLLRMPQARKVIDSNSVRSYLNIIKQVDTAPSLNSMEIKLLHNLESMKNEEGESGTSMREYYLELLRTNRPLLLNKINKLKNIYKQITDHLQQQLKAQTTQQAPTNTPKQAPTNTPKQAPTTYQNATRNPTYFGGNASMA